ncbi:MAG TPA: DUF2802 domain-containing protein [Steroidobacteraceae bacterium]|nr:DUF2802 domain-containing protein [Steroidobacteraceae bacterium]
MTHWSPPSLDVLLLAARAAFLVFSFALAAVAFTRWRRVAERDTAHTTQHLLLLQQRLEQLERAVASCEPRLAKLVAHLEEQPAAGCGPGVNYQIAIRLARSGAKPAELMSDCGLSRQEAELVARLHGRARRVQGAGVAIA